MQRRLNIACSVLHQPQVLLLDEPTVGVDPQSRERIYNMLDSLLANGTAILLTTHQLDEAQTRCDRIAIVDAGQLLDTGTYQSYSVVRSGRRSRLVFVLRTDQLACLRSFAWPSRDSMPSDSLMMCWLSYRSCCTRYNNVLQRLNT